MQKISLQNIRKVAWIQEDSLPWPELLQGLIQLDQAIQHRNESRVLNLLCQLVPDYQPAIKKLVAAV